MPEAHIFYHLGNDEFAIRKQAEKMAGSMFTDPTAAGMNTSRLDARTAGENELSNAIGAMPFLATQRLVVLENVSKKYTGLDGHKKFLAFLETIPPSTRLVMIDFDEIKERDIPANWLVKWSTKNTGKAEYKVSLMPRQKEMPAWIVAETKRQGGAISAPGAKLLAEMTGEDTRQAAQEITKLLTYVNYAHAIDVEDVEAVSIMTASMDVFNLVDALGRQEGKTAQKLFHQLLDEKDAFEIFGMVVRQFRLLILARDVIDEGGKEEDVKDVLGVHPFVAEKLYNQAKTFTMATLDAIYHRLLAIDEASKTGGMPLVGSLDMFIMELSGRR